MPAIGLNPEDSKAVAAYVRSVVGMIGVQGTPPELGKEAPSILVGNAAEGKAYFSVKCGNCHSLTGDLEGIATRIPDARILQTTWVAGGRERRGVHRQLRTSYGHRNHHASIRGNHRRPIGPDRRLHGDPTIADGTQRTFRRDGDVPKVVVQDPMKVHRELLPQYTDKDIHDVTAYLVTLK